MNAGKGDSIVLQHEEGEVTSFGVIDSNAKFDQVPPALRKLRELGAQTLNFVMLTHPHADHYLGLEQVLEEFRGNVDGIFTFPLEVDRDRIRNLARRYATAAKGSGDSAKITAASIIKILKFARSNDGDWEAPTGLLGILPVSGFHGVRFRQILPPSRVKGRFFAELDAGTYEPESPHANDLSLAVLLDYGATRIVLGADGTQANWLYQARRLGLAGAEEISSQVVKLPHHGSREDCSAEVLDKLFSPGVGRKIALISANGTTHPSADVLRYIRENQIEPYCTNLSKHCGGGKIANISAMPDVDPALKRFVNSVVADDSRYTPGACQGNIEVQIASDGQINVVREFSNFCPYRDSLTAA